MDDYAREFERLFEDSYGHRAEVDTNFKGILKRDIFVQGLLLKWQEKVLPSAETFADALHQARTAEEQEKQLGEMHPRNPKEVTKDPPGKSAGGTNRNTPGEQQNQRFTPRGSGSTPIRCAHCRGIGHLARDCRKRQQKPTEATGGGGSGGSRSGTSSAVTAERSEIPSDHCQRLQQEWVDAEFSRLSCVYSPEATVDAVKGALGPLFYATVSIAGTSVESLVDPGSSATIMSFELFKKIGAKAGIPREALQKPNITLRDYSRRPIPIFAKVDLEFSYQDKQIITAVYLRSDQGTAGEPCLLGTNVVIPLGLMVPGPGVATKELGLTQVGTVRLVRAERIPSQCGVVMDAQLTLEHMLVEPDSAGKVSIVVTNPSYSEVKLDTGQCVGRVHPCVECAGEAVVADEVALVCHVVADDADLEAVSKRMEKLSGILRFEKESEAIREQVLGAHDVFAVDEGELGEVREVQHGIVTGDSPPIRQPVRRVPFALREKVAGLVNDMLSGGIIRESDSPWASPVVLVKKKSGDLRFCVDYRRLNAVTRKDVFPIPRIDDLLDQLNGKRVFSTLDAKSGYWQIQVDSKSKAKTAFITPGGLFEFNVMPFGLCNAPATFQRLMQRMLAGLESFCSVYIDDIIVFSGTEEEHVDHLRQIFERFRRFSFAQEQVEYLGHVISAKGIAPNPGKVRAVQEFPVPTSVKGVRQFLGMASYYRRFMPGFAKTAAPLHALTRESVPFFWSIACQGAFLCLKDLLVSPPVLAYPNFDKSFVMHTDASILGLGAVPEQEQEDGKLHPIAYASRSLSKAERNYGITEMEALGVVWGAKHFRAYLYGHKCIVYTDHSPLRSMLNAQHPSGKLARWSQSLCEFDLELRYRPGRVNSNADALSRAPVVGYHHLENDDEEAQIAQVSADHEVNDTPQPISEVAELQLADVEVGQVLRYVRDGVEPVDARVKRYVVLEKEKFVVLEGVLYFVDPARKDRIRLVVPEVLRQSLMEEVHNGGFSGHFAVKGLYEKLVRRYWWKGMYSDVYKFCKSCLTCAAYRGGGRRLRPTLMSLPVGGPFERVGVDLMEMPQTTLGNRYVIVFLDYLTKWVEAYPLADQTSETIARVHHSLPPPDGWAGRELQSYTSFNACKAQ